MFKSRSDFLNFLLANILIKIILSINFNRKTLLNMFILIVKPNTIMVTVAYNCSVDWAATKMENVFLHDIFWNGVIFCYLMIRKRLSILIAVDRNVIFLRMLNVKLRWAAKHPFFMEFWCMKFKAYCADNIILLIHLVYPISRSSR